MVIKGTPEEIKKLLDAIRGSKEQYEVEIDPTNLSKKIRCLEN